VSPLTVRMVPMVSPCDAGGPRRTVHIESGMGGPSC
jgi:hypothetical protein